MSLKLILAVAGGGDDDHETLAFAASLAAQHNSVVEILPAYPDTSIDMITLGLTLGASLSAQAIAELTAAEHELHTRIETAARRAADEADVAFGGSEGAPRMVVLERGLRPALALSRALVLADLVVIGQAYLKDAGRDGELLAQALLQHRAPVLVARGAADGLAGPAAIAWDGSPQAGRAVQRSLPLLAMASGLYVIQCISGLDPTAADPDISRLNAYLKLHGVGGGERLTVEGEAEGGALLAAARARNVTMLVAGAYGHSRMREAMFGGATRAFLGDVDGPSLLLSH